MGEQAHAGGFGTSVVLMLGEWLNQGSNVADESCLTSLIEFSDLWHPVVHCEAACLGAGDLQQLSIAERCRSSYSPILVVESTVDRHQHVEAVSATAQIQVHNGLVGSGRPTACSGRLRGTRALWLRGTQGVEFRRQHHGLLVDRSNDMLRTRCTRLERSRVSSAGTVVAHGFARVFCEPIAGEEQLELLQRTVAPQGHRNGFEPLRSFHKEECLRNRAERQVLAILASFREAVFSQLARRSLRTPKPWWQSVMPWCSMRENMPFRKFTTLAESKIWNSGAK